MCGNGIRCVAKYVYDHHLTDKTEISIDTLAGIKYLKLTVENGKVVKVRVNMGQPILAPDRIPVIAEKEPVVAEPIKVCGKEWKMTCVSMGNPHAVIFIDTPVKEFPLEEIGPHFENHARFPKRTNTEFVRVLDRQTLEMRVWERGSGETLAWRNRHLCDCSGRSTEWTLRPESSGSSAGRRSGDRVERG